MSEKKNEVLDDSDIIEVQREYVDEIDALLQELLEKNKEDED